MVILLRDRVPYVLVFVVFLVFYRQLGANIDSFQLKFVVDFIPHQQKIIMLLVRRCCVRMLGVGNFAPVAPCAFCGGLRHSVACDKQ